MSTVGNSHASLHTCSKVLLLFVLLPQAFEKLLEIEGILERL